MRRANCALALFGCAQELDGCLVAIFCEPLLRLADKLVEAVGRGCQSCVGLFDCLRCIISTTESLDVFRVIGLQIVKLSRLERRWVREHHSQAAVQPDGRAAITGCSERLVEILDVIFQADPELWRKKLIVARLDCLLDKVKLRLTVGEVVSVLPPNKLTLGRLGSRSSRRGGKVRGSLLQVVQPEGISAARTGGDLDLDESRRKQIRHALTCLTVSRCPRTLVPQEMKPKRNSLSLAVDVPDQIFVHNKQLSFKTIDLSHAVGNGCGALPRTRGLLHLSDGPDDSICLLDVSNPADCLRDGPHGAEQIGKED